MAADTLTFALNGEVTLQEYARAINEFSGLISELSKEVSGEANIDWSVDDLHYGSAVASIRGESANITAVERVVVAYTNIGKSIEKGERIAYSRAVQLRVQALTSVVDGKVTSMQFASVYGEATIGRYSGDGQTQTGKIIYSLGTVTGLVETLSKRKQYRLVVYDALSDHAITCFLTDEQEEQMRSVWGKRVVVSGTIGRDAITGKPVTVKRVTDIREMREIKPGSYKRARGILPNATLYKSAVEIIREVRNA